MQVELRDRPVFICGHPKSGTSLMRSLLDAHPELVVYPEEAVFFRRYLPAAKGKSLEEKLLLAEAYLIHIFTWNRHAPPPSQSGFPDRDYSDISYDDVCREMRRQLAADGYRHDGDILSAAVLAFGKVTGQVTDKTLWWVEKTPYNERYVEQIFSWWPQARCIHIFRDPRDNYLSYHKKHSDWTAETFATSWRDSTHRGIENKRRYGPDRYLFVRYEDLTQIPEQTLEEIRQYLGIGYDRLLWIPTRNHVAWQGNSMFSERFNRISGAPVERWKGKLAPEEAGVIQLIAGSQMQESRYQSVKVPPRSYLRYSRWGLSRLQARLHGR